MVPTFFAIQELLQPNPQHKITQDPSSTALKTAENTKCLDSTSPTTILPISMLLTMCGVTLLRPTWGRRFWLGYLHLNLRYGTTTSEPVESTEWGTGSFKLRNIGIGSVVFVGVNLMVQPCFVPGVRGLARLSLGEREATRGKKDIVNKPPL